MKTIMIEKLRYELHQEFLKEPYIQTYKQNLTTKSFWKEVGAFTCIAPRQAGKTNLLKTIALELLNKQEQVVIIVPNDAMLSIFQKDFMKNPGLILCSSDKIQNYLRGFNLQNYNLFVDEFMHIENSIVEQLLDINWKSVNLFSSLK